MTDFTRDDDRRLCECLGADAITKYQNQPGGGPETVRMFIAYPTVLSNPTDATEAMCLQKLNDKDYAVRVTYWPNVTANVCIKLGGMSVGGTYIDNQTRDGAVARTALALMEQD